MSRASSILTMAFIFIIAILFGFDLLHIATNPDHPINNCEKRGQIQDFEVSGGDFLSGPSCKITTTEGTYAGTGGVCGDLETGATLYWYEFTGELDVGGCS